MWALLDSYTHDLARYILSQAPGVIVNIPQIISAMPFPFQAKRLMTPQVLYHYRSDIFLYKSSMRVGDAIVELTKAGARLGRCPAPDVSRSHQAAIARVVESGVMDQQRGREIDSMQSHVAPAEWGAFKSAVQQFCRKVTEKMREDGGRVALSKLGQADLPEALRRWLAKHDHEVSWFLDRMLSRTFVMRSDVDPIEDKWESKDIYVSDFLDPSVI